MIRSRPLPPARSMVQPYVSLRLLLQSKAWNTLTRWLRLTKAQSAAHRAPIPQPTPGFLHRYENFLPAPRKPVRVVIRLAVLVLMCVVDGVKPAKGMA